jgi:hypothetical protein
MNMDESVYISLIDMGIDPDQSRRAACRFDDTAAAINWVFEGGLVSIVLALE